MTADAADAMDVLDPPGITARFQGRVIEIKPMPVGKLPAFSRAFRPLLPMIDKFESFSQMDLMELMADHGENLIEAVSIASGISKAELNAAQPVDLIALLAPVLQVNQDFFRLRLLARQAVRAAAGAMMTVVPGAGPTP